MRITVGDERRFESPPGAGERAGDWPARWVCVAGRPPDSFVAAYRLRFEVAEETAVRMHVTADQRYELLLDGRRIGRGPERGEEMCWFYESYESRLTPGAHTLVARTWWLTHEDHIAPTAQRTIRPGFVLAAEGDWTERLSTGLAPWQGKVLGGYTFVPPSWKHSAHLAGGTIVVNGRAFDWGWETGEGEGWQDVVAGPPGRDRINRFGQASDAHRLRPATLPAMKEITRHLGNVRHVDAPTDGDTDRQPVLASTALRDEQPLWQRVLAGQGSHRVPPHTRRRVVVDLEDYYCAYPQLTLSGGRGAVVRMHWAESLFHAPASAGADGPGEKGNRDHIEGKYFHGRGDRFIADGGDGRVFDTLWWACGRYVELYIETQDEPLTVDDVCFRETGYPLHMDGQVELSDERFNRAVPIMWRTLQMCMHETYMDCPYYEQLMYVGDTRLQALVTYLMSRDDRLARKAIRMLATSAGVDGLAVARAPSHLVQVIPQFSLFFVAMVYDWALWRGEREAVRRIMPRVRAVLEVFIDRINEQGLVEWPEGWNWVDWVPGWQDGTPPQDASGQSAINNWQLVYVLGLAEELEQWMGESELVARLERIRHRVAAAATAAFWDESRGLFADTPAHSSYSEHAQCYALLSGMVDAERAGRVIDGLLRAPNLARATIYFQHYLFEVLARYGQPDAMLERWSLWYGLSELGMKTCLEQPEPSRSDCHAWGAHPIYHAAASIAGVRPAGLGRTDLLIRPQLGRLRYVRCTVVHPGGQILVDLHQRDGGVGGVIELPPGLRGFLQVDGGEQALRPGINRIG